jgi:hypothetical protein
MTMTILGQQGSSPDEAIEQVASRSRLDVAVVSALLWMPDKNGIDVWAIFLTTSERGAGQSEFQDTHVVFGPCKVDTSDCPLAADVVGEVPPGGELAMSEAEVMRQDFIAAARRRFATVLVCDTEVEAISLQASLWPGERIRELAASIAALRGRHNPPHGDDQVSLFIQGPLISPD